MNEKNKFERENEEINDFDDTLPEDENTDYDEYSPSDEDTADFPEDETIVFSPREKKKKKQKKLSRGQKTALAVVCFLYVAVVLVAAFLLFYKPTTRNSGIVPFDVTEDDSPKGENDVSNKRPTNSGNYVEVGESYNILLVGHDKLAHLADVTMIVNCDAENNKITVMQIPRDTYVSLEPMTGKVNAMYSGFYNQARRGGADDPYLESLDEYAKFLEQNLCINIHQTAIIDLEGFKSIVDVLGGVDVYVPNDMYYSDPEQGLYINIPAGEQHMDGAMAEGFVRFRSGYVQADLGRVNAQKIFMTAFFNKLKSTVKSVDVSTLNSLMDEIKKNVHTEMSALDILYYAKITLKINLEDITMLTVPGSVAGNYYVINREATRTAINNYFNVYSKEISDNIFDRNNVFCNTGSGSISAVYYGDTTNVLDGEYTADSIDDVYIPRTNYSSGGSNSWGSVPVNNSGADNDTPDAGLDADVYTGDDITSPDEENDGGSEPSEDEIRTDTDEDETYGDGSGEDYGDEAENGGESEDGAPDYSTDMSGETNESGEQNDDNGETDSAQISDETESGSDN